MKQVQKTAEIIERIKAAFGADVDPNAYAVFEATAINNLPIRQKHPLFEGAIAQMSLRQKLVSAIKEESVPYQIMHKGGELPAGRVFDAKLHGEDVRILIGIHSTPESAKLISDMDAGIVDQVSVNLLAEQLLCSASGCGFDYLGEDADYMNILNAECANGHKLREDGTHIQLHGLDHVLEISAVNTGGATGARIHGRDNQAFASESFQRLAASGLAPAMLVASITAEGTEPMTTPADLTALVAAAAADKAAVTTLTAERDAQVALVAARDATITELNGQVETLTAERDAAVATAAPDAAVLEFISDACKKALIAKGDQNPTVPEKIEDQLKAITEAGVMLSMIPAGGRANSNPSDLGNDKDAPAANSAFRRAK